MKKLILLTILTLLALAFFLSPRKVAEEELAQSAEVPQKEWLPYSPNIRTSIRQIVPPPTQSTLLEDTELETDIRVSLEKDKSIVARASVESVNCVEARCQILMQSLADQEFPTEAIRNQLEQHPQFGKSLLVTPYSDSENKKLKTFIFSPETQVSANH